MKDSADRVARNGPDGPGEHYDLTGQITLANRSCYAGRDDSEEQDHPVKRKGPAAADKAL